METLEKRQLLAADIVIAPVDADLISVNGSYLNYDDDGQNWYNGSGLTDASMVETGDPVPATWPEHESGHNAGRIERIRDAAEFNTLIVDLGGSFNVNGMTLWNSTEVHDGTLQTDRGFENTRLSYSTDGGITFFGDDLLTWTERNAAADLEGTFAPEVQSLPLMVSNVTHVRMEVDNFSPDGSDNIVMASELRFIGEQQYPGSAGEILADYQFSNHTASDPDLVSRDSATGSTASDITSPQPLSSTGIGQPARGLRLGPAWNSTSRANSGSNSNDYIEFSITPDSGQSLDLDYLSFQLYRSESDSKNSFAVYYDQGGSGSDNFNSLLHGGQINSVNTWESIDVALRGRPDLTNLSNEVKFRIFFWGADGVDDLYVDNVRVHEVGTNVVGSTYAHYGTSGHLIQPLDELGNRLPDFSAAGYKYGEEPIPNVDALFDSSRIVTVSPGAGDDTSRIQNAIDQVSAFSLKPDGFRGLVQLTAGEFQTDDQVSILASGVVLRGVGDGSNSASSSILRGTGTDERSLVLVGGTSSPSHVAASRQEIVDKYVPVGATSFTVADAGDFSVGMEIRIIRPSPQNWITDIEMDQIPPKTNGTTGLVQWQAGRYDIEFERIITRIEGDRIFFNAPIVNSLEQQYGGGQVYRLNDPRITNVGIEQIRGTSDFASNTDENHARNFIQLRAVKDAWVRNITGEHFVYATVFADPRSKAVTVQDARSLDPKSQITGGRRYAFNIEGQFILMRDLYSEEGRHDFVNNGSSFNHGPNVFLNGVAERTHQNIGPHQRWATGTLYDTITSNRDIEARDGGNAGSGHGWRGANMAFWNVTAPGLHMQNPITAQNWFIGATGTDRGVTSNTRDSANMDSRNQPIDFGDPDNPTSSLYIAQRNDADLNPDIQRFEYLVGDYDRGEDDTLNVDSVINPRRADLTSVGGSYLDFDSDSDNWFNGSGLDNASLVTTGSPVPDVWPEHQSGHSSNRIARIRDAQPVNELTFDLGGSYDVKGMVLWNSTEDGHTDRGFENTVLSYSTDGGTTFFGNDTLSWTERNAAGDLDGLFGPEVQELPNGVESVTHIRMQVDNFDGGGTIVMASEIRFIGDPIPADLTNANSQWVSTVEAHSDLKVLKSMDGVDQDGITPISVVANLTSDEVVESALVSIGIRDVDNAETGQLWIESASNRRSFASLGMLASTTFGRTQVATFEITGEDLDAFQDGRLDLAVSDAVVDWVNVQINVGRQQSAFVQQTVADGTVIHAENFDAGGQGIAYADSTRGNLSSGNDARRDEDVDLQAGSIFVNRITDGEWLEYTLDVTPGVYDVDVRAWSTNDNIKGVRLLVAENGSSQSFTELGAIDIPNTNNDRLLHTIHGVDLTAWGGEDRVLRVEFYGGDFDFDTMEFSEVAANVVGRGVAYRGATAAFGEETIDPTKSALRDPGASASTANYTNYTEGLNRIVVDIENLTATELAESDFEFRVGNSEDVGNNLEWTSMSPSAINVTPLSGTTKRVTIDWPDQAIVNQWLEVTVKANANTKLAQDDMFYFGNQVGDVDGSTSTSTNRVTVNAFDVLDVRFNQSPSNNSVGIGHVYDVDRSGSVNAFDVLDVRFNQMPAGGLMMITLPTAAPPAASSVLLQNPDNAMDVNGDGQITALDALIGINFLGQTAALGGLMGSGERAPSSEHFYDVNGDGMVTALDSLMVINMLESSTSQQAEPISIPLLSLESDREDELGWASDRPLQDASILDLALRDWDEE